MPRALVTLPDERLRIRCAPIASIGAGTRELAADLLEQADRLDGLGMAAPQLGVLVRLIAVRIGEKWIAAVNPEFEPGARRARRIEGCLSIPGVQVLVERADVGWFRWTDLDGAQHERKVEGLDAVVVQHELDHLDGVTMLDRTSGTERRRVREALV